MKNILIFLLLILPFASNAQVYQKPNLYGLEYNRLFIEHSLKIPHVDVIGELGIKTNLSPQSIPGTIQYVKQDSSIYAWTGYNWVKQSGGGGGGSTPTIDAVLAAGATATNKTFIMNYPGGAGANLVFHSSGITYQNANAGNAGFSFDTGGWMLTTFNGSGNGAGSISGPDGGYPTGGAFNLKLPNVGKATEGTPLIMMNGEAVDGDGNLVLTSTDNTIAISPDGSGGIDLSANQAGLNDVLTFNNTAINKTIIMEDGTANKTMQITSDYAQASDNTTGNAAFFESDKIWFNQAFGAGSVEIKPTTLTDARLINIPDKNGTIALISDMPVVTSNDGSIAVNVTGNVYDISNPITVPYSILNMVSTSTTDDTPVPISLIPSGITNGLYEVIGYINSGNDIRIVKIDVALKVVAGTPSIVAPDNEVVVGDDASLATTDIALSIVGNALFATITGLPATTTNFSFKIIKKI